MAELTAHLVPYPHEYSPGFTTTLPVDIAALVMPTVVEGSVPLLTADYNYSPAKASPSIPVAAHLVPDFANDFYSHYFLTPSRLDQQDIRVDLGIISENRHVELQLWNLYPPQMRVVSVAYNYPSSGVTVQSPVVLDTVAPFGFLPLVLYVTLAGPHLFAPVITITLEETTGLNIGTTHTVVITVSGTRAQKEFTFLSDANWSGGLSMSSRWLTSIYAASEVSETRQLLRSRPCREMSFEFGVTGKDFITAAWGYLQALARRRTYMPLWQDVSVVQADWEGGKLLCDTSYRRFYTGQVIVIRKRRYDNSTYEGTRNDTAIYYTATITGVEAEGLYILAPTTAEINAGDVVYPGILSEIAVDENSITAVSAERAIVQVTLNEVFGENTMPITNSAYSPTLFYSMPFFNFEWNRTKFPVLSVSRPADVEESGRYQMVRTRTGFSQTSIGAKVSAHNRQEWWSLAGFFDYIKGRYKPFWVKNPLSTFRKGNYELYSGSNLIEIELVTYGGGNNIYSTQALWLKNAAGVEKITKVNAILAASSGGYVFQIDPVLITDVTEIKQAFLVRNESDEVTEHWYGVDNVVEWELNLVELPGGYQ